MAVTSPSSSSSSTGQHSNATIPCHANLPGGGKERSSRTVTEWTRMVQPFAVMFHSFCSRPGQCYVSARLRGPKGDVPLLISVGHISDPLERHAAAAAAAEVLQQQSPVMVLPPILQRCDGTEQHRGNSRGRTTAAAGRETTRPDDDDDMIEMTSSC